MPSKNTRNPRNRKMTRRRLNLMQWQKAKSSDKYYTWMRPTSRSLKRRGRPSKVRRGPRRSVQAINKMDCSDRDHNECFGADCIWTGRNCVQRGRYVRGSKKTKAYANTRSAKRNTSTVKNKAQTSALRQHRLATLYKKSHIRKMKLSTLKKVFKKVDLPFDENTS